MTAEPLAPSPLDGAAQKNGRRPIAALHDMACVAHVHSTYSDGTASVEEIIAIAAEAGRDVVLLTDHDSMGAKRDGCEGWHGSVLLLVGVEISPQGGHYLAFGLEHEIEADGRPEAALAAAVQSAGGFGFAAHPFSEGVRMSHRLGRPHGWPPADRPGLGGIELWNLTTDAAEAWRHPLQMISYLRDPERNLDGPPRHHLDAWDRLCAGRRVAAIGGLDAHQHGIRIRGRLFSPMRHERYFGILATYALCDRPPSGELGADAAAVYEALREGRAYLGVDTIAPARGFRFWAESDDEVAVIGEERPAKDWTLKISSPATSEIALLRDGEPVARAEGAATLEHRTTDPGVYRVEARRDFRGRRRPWILSNPIYLR